MPLYTGPHKSAAPFRNHSPLLVASDVGGAAHSSIAELPFSLNNTLTPTATYSSELEEEADHEHEPVSWSTICCGWSEHYCWYWWGAVVFGVGAVGYVVSSTYGHSFTLKPTRHTFSIIRVLVSLYYCHRLGIMGHCGTLVPCERIDLANAVVRYFFINKPRGISCSIVYNLSCLT